MRLIDADAIKLPKGFFEKVDNVPKFYEWLNEQPTIEERKTGRWIDHKRDKWIYARCSECGSVHDVRSNFCPNCGARMVGNG